MNQATNASQTPPLDSVPLHPIVRPEPCPFCGSEAMVMTWETNDDPRLPGWHCGCLEPDCDMNPFTKTRWKSKREAIESWNRRSNDALCDGGPQSVESK
jgi:hypothetical protein